MLTIISGMIILIWLIVQVIHVLELSYHMTWSQKLASPDPSEPVYFAIDQQNLTIANSFATTNTTALPGDLRQYVDTVYAQVSYNTINQEFSHKYYKSVPCSEVIADDDPRFSETQNYYCPDMSADQLIYLQGQSGLLQQTNSERFVMIMGACEELVNITGSTNCQPKSTLTDNLQYLQAQAAYFTLFFDPTVYQTSGRQLQYERKFDANTFLLELGQSKALFVQQQQISLDNSWLCSFL